jgi:RimJ/RimL family protein N-acetyltransferase
VAGLPPVPEIRTDRLLLRALREEDLPGYREIFNDPEVIRYLPIQPPGLTEEQVSAGYGRVA